MCVCVCVCACIYIYIIIHITFICMCAAMCEVELYDLSDSDFVNSLPGAGVYIVS